MRIAHVVLTASLLAGCASFRRHDATPHIDEVQPDSVTLAEGNVVEIVIRGRGFAPGSPGGNTIVFGTAELRDVIGSADGREIRMMVPERLAPKGDAAPLPVDAGRYTITVRTANGSSNVVTLRVGR